MKRAIFTNQSGIALVMALLVSVAIMALVTGTLLLIDRSTQVSGAGKIYGTAEEAADGAVNIMKDTVNQTINGNPPVNIFEDSGDCTGVSSVANISQVILIDGAVCVTSIALPGPLNTQYNAGVTLERLYSVIPPGARTEFARSHGAGGGGGRMVFFRITTKVVNQQTGTTAENSVLYRFSG